MKSLELRWGLIIGLTSMIWLYASYYLGFHTSGIEKMQMLVLISFLLCFVVYFLAFLALMKREPETTFPEGVKSGLLMTAVAAVIALLTQLGYFTVVNPGWTDYMVEETRLYFSEKGVEGEALEARLEEARTNFSLRSYLFQSALGTLVIGALFSAIIMGAMVLRRKR